MKQNYQRILTELFTYSDKRRIFKFWQNNKKHIKILAKGILTACLLYFIFRKINLNALQGIILQLSMSLFFVAVLINSMQIPLVGYRWRRIICFINKSSDGLSLADVQATNVLAVFMGQVLPSLTADALRIYWLHKKRLSLTQALVSVFLDRILALYVFLFMSLTIIYYISFRTDLRAYSSIFLTLILFIGLGGLVGSFLSKAIGKKLINYPRFEAVAHLLIDLKKLLLSKTSLLLISLCFLVHLMTIACLYFLGLSLHLDLSLTDAAIFMICMVLATLTPISIGGWGLREIVAMSLAEFIPGLTVEGATALSLLFGIVGLLGALLPLAYWRDRLPINILVHIRTHSTS